MELTANEKKVISHYVHEICGGDMDTLSGWLYDTGILYLSFSDFSQLGFTEKSLKGIIGSLVKKNILTPDADFDDDMKKQGFEQALFLNEKFIAEKYNLEFKN